MGINPLSTLQTPRLSDQQISRCVRDTYGLIVTQLEFLPLGHDPAASVYRVGADDGAQYFLKVRTGPIDPASVAGPRALAGAGVGGIVAPILPVAATRPWATVDDHALLLYPFIQGESAMERGLTDPQWVEYGSLLRMIHQASIPEEVRLQVPRESFKSVWARGVRRLQAALGRSDDHDPQARELANIWNEWREEITHVLRRVDELGRQLRDGRLAFVLCHTDPHTNNVLIDAAGRLFLVDWDTPLLAPKERDLHFVVGSAIGKTAIEPREEELIFQGYGPTSIDWQALIYYRYEWLCGDLLVLGEQVLAAGDPGHASREAAILATRRMFQTGNAVASAYELERRQPYANAPVTKIT